LFGVYLRLQLIDIGVELVYLYALISI
jgi:hypothetical protein